MGESKVVSPSESADRCVSPLVTFETITLVLTFTTTLNTLSNMAVDKVDNGSQKINYPVPLILNTFTHVESSGECGRLVAKMAEYSLSVHTPAQHEKRGKQTIEKNKESRAREEKKEDSNLMCADRTTSASRLTAGLR